MPSKLTITIETDDGPRRDLSSIVIPDWPAHRGQGSTFRAERLASRAMAAIAEGLDREHREDLGPA